MDWVLGILGNDAVQGFLAATGVAVIVKFLGPLATKNSTTRARLRFVARHAKELFFDVEAEADELGIKKFDKLARLLGKLSAKMEAAFGDGKLTPEEEAEAAKVAAALAEKAKK